jgi:ATP adenylyltransferase
MTKWLNHIIVTTKASESQNEHLHVLDLDTLWSIVVDTNGIGYYDKGKNSGSQNSRKHMKIIPRESMKHHQCPLEMYLESKPLYLKLSGFGKLDMFHFNHCIYYLHKTDLSKNPAETLHRIYAEMLRRCGIGLGPDGKSADRSYNFIITRELMLLVPRRYQSYKNIRITGLSFLGMIRTRNQHELTIITEKGPIAVLGTVSMEDFRV